MSNFFFYLGAFALLLGLLIVVHELGHYFVARLAGVRILRFSVGFGHPVLTRCLGKDQTEWSLGLFPLGGYVKMLDEHEGDVLPGELHRCFNRQNVWKRVAIVIAGPLANLLLAVAVYWGLFMHGAEELRPVLGAPALSSPAERAGVEDGERVIRIGGDEVQTWSEMRWILVRRMIEQDSIELELINRNNEINFRHLNLLPARTAGEGGDPLEKLGLSHFRPIIPAIIGRTTPGSVAAAAGLVAGDEILSVDGKPVASWSDVVQTVRSSPRIPLKLSLRRGMEQIRVELVPEAIELEGQEIGRIGAAVDESLFPRDDLLVTVRYGVFSALGKAVNETWDKSVFSLQAMGKMLTGVVSWRNLSGPVSIADYAGQSAKLGTAYYLKFMALVSISLAVFNLLPVPILDGGHLLYYVAEIIRGKPLPEQYMEIGQKVGLALILMLMAFAFYNDLLRLISG